MDNEKKQSELKKEKLIAYLIHCIDQEYKKPLDEIDMDYIDECVEFLLDLQGIDATLTPEVIKEKVSEISTEWIEEEKRNENLEKGENKKKIKKHVTVKRIGLIAACIGLLVALFALASVAFEWTFFDDIIEKFGSVSQAPESEWFEVNGESVKKGEGTRIYSSVTEFIQAEKIMILYPTVLPKNIVMQSISICYIDGKPDVSILFDDHNLSCSITPMFNISQNILNICTETLVINELECYFCIMEDVSVVQVYFEHDNNLYMYSYNDKQVLIDIIKNLEEVQ